MSGNTKGTIIMRSHPQNSRRKSSPSEELGKDENLGQSNTGQLDGKKNPRGEFGSLPNPDT